MSKRVLFIIAIIASSIGLFAQTNPSVTLKKQIAANLSLAVEQYQILHRNVPANRMPQNFDINTGQMVTSNTKWWCAGFFQAHCGIYMTIVKTQIFKKLQKSDLT